MSIDVLTPRDRKRLLAVHDASLSLDGRGPFRDVCRALTETGADVHVAAAEDDLAAHDFARDAFNCNGYDAVLVSGNDDTVTGVALGLADTGMPFGLIPRNGSSNLARHVGLHGKPSAVADMLCNAPDAMFPGGVVNNAAFRAMAGFGGNAQILDRLSRHLLLGTGKPKSSVSLVKELVQGVDRIDVVVDGMNYRCCCLFVTRANGYGALLGEGSATAGSEYHLRVVLVDADDQIALSSILWAAKRGRLLDHPAVDVRLCRHVEIPVEQDFAVEIDGAPLAMDMEVQRQSGDLLVLVDPDPFHVIIAPDVAENLLPWRAPEAAEAA
ncbi:MAG: diacylglycerol/lipid kinase family protein [Hyphomicrobiaceae bacterium]